MGRTASLVAGIAAAALSSAALAAPRLESVAVEPNPAPVRAGKPTEVAISVTIDRPSPFDVSCTAIVDPGDGGRKLDMSWEFGERRTKTTRYEYKKPGTYRVRVAGAGKTPCIGTAGTTVIVGSRTAAAAPEKPAAKAEKAAPKADKAAKVAQPDCPSGWTLVKESVKGARYTCRAKPPAQALKCPEGTKYFADKGEIGCR
jgi:hypothetical protein